MPTKMMAPNTALYWFDKLAISTPQSPKKSEITAALGSAINTTGAGRNLSAAVVAGYTLNATDSDTQNAQSIIDSGIGAARGAANYEGLISFFWEDDPIANAQSEYKEAHDLFIAKGREGFWIRRVGKPYDTALDVADVVDVFSFQSWTPRVTTQAGGGAIQFTVPFLPTGTIYTNVAIQA